MPEQTSFTETLLDEFQRGPFVPVKGGDVPRTTGQIISAENAGKFKRMLFVIPDTQMISFCPPLSYGYIAEMLRVHGFECRLCDLRLKKVKGNILERAIRQFNPDLIAISIPFTIHSYQILRYFNSIKKIFGTIPVFLGGAHVSLRGHNILADCDFAAAAVRGEGEFPLLAVMKGIPLREIAGLWFREGGRIIETAPPVRISDLDALPFPRYEGADIRAYARKGQLDIVTSRGCPFNCTFCTVNFTLGGRQTYYRSPENILDEIRYWYGRGIRLFDFHDDTLNLPANRFVRFLDLLIAEKLTEAQFICSQGLRAKGCTAGILLKMKQAGFKAINFGVESASNRMLAIMKKNETIEDIEPVIAQACELGFEVGIFFIAGYPLEREEDLLMSLEFARKYPVAATQWSICIPYPGTEVACQVEKQAAWFIKPAEYLGRYGSMNYKRVFDNGIPEKKLYSIIRQGLAVDAEKRRNTALARLNDGGFKNVLGRMFVRIATHPWVYQNSRLFSKTAAGAMIKNGIAGFFNLQGEYLTGIRRKRTKTDDREEAGQ